MQPIELQVLTCRECSGEVKTPTYIFLLCFRYVHIRNKLHNIIFGYLLFNLVDLTYKQYMEASQNNIIDI